MRIEYARVVKDVINDAVDNKDENHTCMLLSSAYSMAFDTIPRR